MINLVKPKPNGKPQFFCKTEQKTESNSFLLTAHPLVLERFVITVACLSQEGVVYRSNQEGADRFWMICYETR